MLGIVNPGIYLAGASGGVYALITAHIATIIMVTSSLFPRFLCFFLQNANRNPSLFFSQNYHEMEFAIVQLFVFLIFCITDVGMSVYRHAYEMHDQVGYVAHLSGAVAGLLVGIGVLRNLKVRPWERALWWIAVTMYVVLMLTGISIHIFYRDHFPLPRSAFKGQFE